MAQSRDKDLKKYVIHKYIMAKSCRDALDKEKRHVADEVFLDDEWLKKHPNSSSTEVIGFKLNDED